MLLRLDASVYSLAAVKKAAYRCLDRFAADIQCEAGGILCELTFTPGLGEDEQTAQIAEFRKEILDQDLRETIARETETVRNAILAVAFSPVSSCSE